MLRYYMFLGLSPARNITIDAKSDKENLWSILTDAKVFWHKVSCWNQNKEDSGLRILYFPIKKENIFKLFQAVQNANIKQ